MCDQDHYDDDLKTYTTKGAVSRIEVYPAAHGWCPPNPAVYNEQQAETAWGRMLVLFKKALA